MDGLAAQLQQPAADKPLLRFIAPGIAGSALRVPYRGARLPLGNDRAPFLGWRVRGPVTPVPCAAPVSWEQAVTDALGNERSAVFRMARPWTCNARCLAQTHWVDTDLEARFVYECLKICVKKGAGGFSEGEAVRWEIASIDYD
jgi:hypothetical protein